MIFDELRTTLIQKGTLVSFQPQNIALLSMPR